MSYSLDITNAQAFQAYVEQHASTLYTKMMLGFKSGMHTTPHEGVKGKKTLNELTLQDLFRRYALSFSAVSNAFSIDPRTIETVRAKADLGVAPAELEDTYIGFLRQTGQNPQDFPFQQYLLDNVLAQYAQEMEIAVWQGVASGAPAASDTLKELFDGYLEKIANAITALDLTAYVSGALTNANILGHVEAMYDQLGDPWKEGPVKCFMNSTRYSMLLQNYRNDISKYSTTEVPGQFKLDIGDCTVIRTPGMGTSSRIIMTTAANLQYAYDGPSDDNIIRFDWNKRVLEMWTDIRIGVEFLWLDDASGAIVVNDQA